MAQSAPNIPPMNEWRYKTSNNEILQGDLPFIKKTIEADRHSRIRFAARPSDSRLIPVTQIPELADSLARRHWASTKRDTASQLPMIALLFLFCILALDRTEESFTGALLHSPIFLMIALVISYQAATVVTAGTLFARHRRGSAALRSELSIMDEFYHSPNWKQCCTRAFAVVAMIVAVSTIQIIADNQGIFSASPAPSILAIALDKQAVVESHQYWRLLSVAYAHLGGAHLFFNSFLLFMAFAFAEFIASKWIGALIFVAGVVSGSILSLIGTPVTAAGASAGVFALAGFGLFFSMRRKPRQVPIDVVVGLVLFPVEGFLLGLYVQSNLFDNYAHFGGYVAGALLAFIPWPRYLQSHAHQAPRWATLGVMGSLIVVVLGALWSIFCMTRVW